MANNEYYDDLLGLIEVEKQQEMQRKKRQERGKNMEDIKNRSCGNCSHCVYSNKSNSLVCIDSKSNETALFIDNPVPGEICINYKRRMNMFQTMDNEKLAEIYKEMLLAERDRNTSPQIKSIAMIVNNEMYNGDSSLYIVIDMVKEQFYKEVCRRYLHPEYKK